MKHGRLIDADALIEAYDRAHEGEPGKARQLILDAPTIEERKTGRWIDITKTGGDFVWIWKCSECGGLNLEDTYFCPECGADMRGEQE